MAPIARFVRRELAVDWTAAEGATLLRGDERPVVLHGRWAGGSTILASDPVITGDVSADDPFALLDELPRVTGTVPPGAIGGGWFGFLGFSLRHRIEALAPDPPATAVLPPFALSFYDHVCRLDKQGRWWFEALETPDRADALERRHQELCARSPHHEPFAAGALAAAGAGTDGHRRAVEQCVGRIAAGELFQANLTLRLEGDFAGDPLDAFAAGLAAEPSYGAFCAGPWGAYVGFSPELFLRRRGRQVQTRPIKGTRARGAGAGPGELLASAKDQAENVMIVDLMRNDLGRVCAYGTVTASAPVAEPHPGVWHLVSEVRGRLRNDVSDAELLRATFPPGSVTGAPKVQALTVIGELEGSARQAYTGAAGFASPLAGLELNVTIRTFEIAGGRIWIGAGGGIVADSDPEAEVEEALAKASPLIAAIGGQLSAGPGPRIRVTAPNALGRDHHRPDPALGVFETIAVQDGTPVALPQHLARLAASAQELYAITPADDLAARVLAVAARSPAPRARLRVDLHERETEISIAPAGPPRTAPAQLSPVVLPGGLGAHKWRDRRLIDALSADGTEPLFLDGDGSVLETMMSNVLVLEGERLITPPADGRILPGITRARLLAGGSVAEEPVDLRRLAEADAVLLTSSIALVRIAGALGRPGNDHRAGELAGDLVAGLRDALRG